MTSHQLASVPPHPSEETAGDTLYVQEQLEDQLTSYLCLCCITALDRSGVSSHANSYQGKRRAEAQKSPLGKLIAQSTIHGEDR